MSVRFLIRKARSGQLMVFTVRRVLNSKLERQQGPFVWDMECSAVAALAKFRGVEVCHFFYAADHLSEGNWDARNLMNHMDLDEKDKVALLALEFACDWSKP